MTVTRDQAQMLAALAVACRPHRAPTWDEAGVMAAIAEIRNMSLPEVVLRTIRAAADRDAITPGVIPKNGPHANEQLKPERWEPTVLDPAERCGICAKSELGCKSAPRVADDDHTFEPDFKHKRDGEAVAQIVASLKAEVAPTPTIAEPKRLDDLLPEDRDPRATEARAQIVTPEPESEEMSADV